MLQMLYSSQSHLAIVSFHSILLHKHFSKSDAISQKRCKNQGTFTPKHLNCSSLSNSLKINTVTRLAFHSSSKYSKVAKLWVLDHGIRHKNIVNYSLGWIEKWRQEVEYPKSQSTSCERKRGRCWCSGLCSSPWATLLLQLFHDLEGNKFRYINYF